MQYDPETVQPFIPQEPSRGAQRRPKTLQEYLLEQYFARRAREAGIADDMRASVWGAVNKKQTGEDE